MRHSSRFDPGQVVHRTSSHGGAGRGHGQGAGVSSGIAGGGAWHVSGVYDPFAMAKEYPDRWAAYIRRFYPGDAQVMAHFHVCEKTARKWRRGEMGCRAHHQSLALLTHGQEAFDMLVRP